MRDLQGRLKSLGFGTAPDPPRHFGDGTEAAVRAFQEHRGLRKDGVCGPQTWSALVEAGRVLGERLLYYRNRMLRGDDVATLQRKLGALGFDAGRVDGIFGPHTQAALCDFQRNTGQPVDGVCGPGNLEMLSRVSARAATTNGQEVVAELRERERLREAPRTLRDRRVIVGETGGLAALVEGTRRILSRSGAVVMTLHDPDESNQAAQANGLRGEVFVGLRLDTVDAGCSTAYFLGYHGVSSEGGRKLAETVQATLPRALGIADRGVHGMRVPLLRETRMPAVLIDLGPASVVVERGPKVAAAIREALRTWVSDPYADER